MWRYFCEIFRKKKLRILIFGLDAAGKTTILYVLHMGEVVTTIPTIGFNVESITLKNVQITAWDVGGRDKIRPLLRHYYPGTDAMIYVIDSSDHDRLAQCRDEIHSYLDEPELANTVYLILANKQDLKTALTLDEIKTEIEFDKLKKHRKVNMFGCSAISKDGREDLYQALDWLSEQFVPATSGIWSWFAGQKVNKTNFKVTDSKPETDSSVLPKVKATVYDTVRPVSSPGKWTLGTYLTSWFTAVKTESPSV